MFGLKAISAPHHINGFDHFIHIKSVQKRRNTSGWRSPRLTTTKQSRAAFIYVIAREIKELNAPPTGNLSGLPISKSFKSNKSPSGTYLRAISFIFNFDCYGITAPTHNNVFFLGAPAIGNLREVAQERVDITPNQPRPDAFDESIVYGKNGGIS